MMGPYVKDPFINRDPRAKTAYDVVNKRVLKKNGGPNNAQVYPVAIYRWIFDGISYNIITAVKDEKKKKVYFVDSTVYTASFRDNKPEEFNIICSERLADIYHQPDKDTILAIENFLYQNQQKIDFTVKAIKSIVESFNVVDDELFYLVNSYVVSEGQLLSRYYIISLDDKKGFNILQIFDFQDDEGNDDFLLRIKKV